MTSWLSSILYLAVYVLALADALFHLPAMRTAAVVALGLFIVLEIGRTARTPLVVGGLLTAGGVGIGFFQGVAVDVLVNGLTRTLPFLLLFGSVAWLQVASAESPTLKATRDAVMSQPPGRRYLILSVAAHGLGSGFNLAGISLLAAMVGQQKDRLLRMRLSRAMVHGFGASAAWSPLFVGTAVILAILPQVRWIEIAPFGFGLAAIFIALTWSMDRLMNPRKTASVQAALPVSFPAWARRRLVIIVAALFAAVIALVEAGGLTIPIALGLIAPAYALLWRASRAINVSNAVRVAGQMSSRIIKSLTTLRGEAILFSGANVFGTGISAAVGPDDARRAIEGVHLTPEAGLMLLAVGIVVCGAAGLHPVILIVLVGHVIPPSVLGVEPQTLAVLLMASWGLSTNISPISATSLFMARITGESVFRVAWQWNAPFCLIAATIVGAAAIAIHRLGVF